MAAVAAQPAPGTQATQNQNQPQYQNAAQAATAAVAAAMAKLPPMPGQQRPGAPPADGMDNLAKKVSEMRTDDTIRRGRGQGTGGYVARGSRGGRGRGSGREFGPGQPHPKVEVPTEDFDFQSANAKFNKQDLVKEAIATGSPLGTPGEEGSGLNGDATDHADTNGAVEESKADDVVIPPAATAPVYNKSTSFFDNLSSELKDRADAATVGKKLGGQEFRREERQKNLETFGQGSVDGYRGGFRGRGRGFRGRGRGFGGRGGRGNGTRGRGGAGNEATF